MAVALLLVFQFLLLLVCGKKEDHKCTRIKTSSPCHQFYQHGSSDENHDLFNVTFNIKNNGDVRSLQAFFCGAHSPPCGHSAIALFGVRVEHVKPCRQFCKDTWNIWRRNMRRKQIPETSLWPFHLRCENLPRYNCFIRNDHDLWRYIPKGGRTTSNHIHILKDDDDELKNIQRPTYNRKIYPRRYDIHDLGSADYFRGWADVQGTGAANDYCRVIGTGRRRFLACALAGSRGRKHEYVSTLGFEVGLKNTWFMRDADGDGRDDYCRCVGNSTESRLTCMKAAKNGFHSSPKVGGSQFSFVLPSTESCYGRQVNPFTGN